MFPGLTIIRNPGVASFSSTSGFSGSGSAEAATRSSDFTELSVSAKSVSKLWFLTSTETRKFIGDGEKWWKGVWKEGGWGVEREIIYLSLHCHHQNDSCIKMGSDESHFNV